MTTTYKSIPTNILLLPLYPVILIVTVVACKNNSLSGNEKSGVCSLPKYNVRLYAASPRSCCTPASEQQSVVIINTKAKFNLTNKNPLFLTMHNVPLTSTLIAFLTVGIIIFRLICKLSQILVQCKQLPARLPKHEHLPPPRSCFQQFKNAVPADYCCIVKRKVYNLSIMNEAGNTIKQ